MVVMAVHCTLGLQISIHNGDEDDTDCHRTGDHGGHEDGLACGTYPLGFGNRLTRLWGGVSVIGVGWCRLGALDVESAFETTFQEEVV